MTRLQLAMTRLQAIPAGLARASACSRLRAWQAGARGLFHQVGVDPVVGDMPVFDGRKVLDGSLKVRLDSVIARHGVLVLGTSPVAPTTPAFVDARW